MGERDLELEVGDGAEETVGKSFGGSIEEELEVIKSWLVSEDCVSEYCWGLVRGKGRVLSAILGNNVRLIAYHPDAVTIDQFLLHPQA